jgi:hypothetical protein
VRLAVLATLGGTAAGHFAGSVDPVLAAEALRPDAIDEGPDVADGQLAESLLAQLRDEVEPRRPTRRLEARQLGREYASTVNTEDPPEAAHLTIDNRLGAAVSLADQTRRTLTRLMP